MPVLLGAGAGILTGSASWLSGLSGRECIARMAVASVLFFMVGLFVRGALRQMVQDVRTRREEAEREAALEEEKRKREEKQAAAADKTAGTLFDQKAGDDLSVDSLNPGRVADFIRQEMQNS